MYISRIVLNQQNNCARKALSDSYQLHQLIWRAFPNKEDGGAGRVMFRLELSTKNNDANVLVQSDNEPNWSAILEDHIILDEKHRPYNPNIKDGDMLRFRLRANPTSRKIVDSEIKDDDGRPLRKRVGLHSEEEQKNWLCEKGRKGGFEIKESQITSFRRITSKKPNNVGNITHDEVIFDGVLKVNDSNVFKQTLENGIGSAKGFGFGMLSIAYL